MRYTKLNLAALLVLIGALAAFGQPRGGERQRGEDNPDMKRVNVRGRIERIEGQRAVLRTEHGGRVTVNLGPERFWQERGYHLEDGARVRVDGWGDLADPDGGYVFAGGIYGDGFSFEICDSRGFPMWADRSDCDEGWYPQRDCYEMYYYGNPWAWSAPPLWWWGPRWRWQWYGYHHLMPPPPPRHGRGGGWHGGGHDGGRHDGPPHDGGGRGGQGGGHGGGRRH